MIAPLECVPLFARVGDVAPCGLIREVLLAEVEYLAQEGRFAVRDEDAEVDQEGAEVFPVYLAERQAQPIGAVTHVQRGRQFLEEQAPAMQGLDAAQESIDALGWGESVLSATWHEFSLLVTLSP